VHFNSTYTKTYSSTCRHYTDDILALGALHGTQQRVCKVPDELSIRSFDNIDILLLLKPSLTMLSLPSDP